MFNLLPESEKKQILDEYNSRRIAIGLVFLFVVGIIAVISLFPAYVLSSAKAKEAESALGSIQNSSAIQEETQLNSELEQANAKLTALRSPNSDVAVSALIQKIIDKKSSNIRISGIRYQKDATSGKGSLALEGIARSRADLSDFVDALKTDQTFSNVDLPVSSFTKDQNADFSLTITGTF